MSDLRSTLAAAAALLPEEFRAAHGRLFRGELLDRLADRLLGFWREGVPAAPPPPRFAAERTPPLADVFAPFRPALALWHPDPGPTAPEVVAALADALLAAGCPGLLLLLGQRLTPASVTDARAIPPERGRLLDAAGRPGRQGLTVAARALSKHAPRSAESFWGAVTGPAAFKNAAARAAVERILGAATWWNVFGHPAHGLVYEARVPTGHGARWRHPGDEFIGFLEPFET
jgi:hypothetical protein